MTVEHMTDVMSARELMEWRAFIEVERMEGTKPRRVTDEELMAAFGRAGG